MICDDFRIKNRIKNLSKEKLTDLNKNKNNDIYFYFYFKKFVE